MFQVAFADPLGAIVRYDDLLSPKLGNARSAIVRVTVFLVVGVDGDDMKAARTFKVECHLCRWINE